MIKVILGLAVVAFGGFMGFFLSKKYRKRKEFYCQLSQFNERFLTEIGYYKRPLTKFLTAYLYKGEFDVLLQYFYQSLQANSLGERSQTSSKSSSIAYSMPASLKRSSFCSKDVSIFTEGLWRQSIG